MVHGDFYGVVALGNGRLRQSVALAAQNHRQLFLRHETAVVNGDGIVAQRHGCGSEAQTVQLLHSLPRPVSRKRPRDLKHRPHADPRAAAVQRVTASGGQQHGVHAQRGGGTEDRAHVGGVLDVFQNHDPCRPGADILHGGKPRAAHGAQHAPGQVVAGEIAQQLLVRGIHGNAGTAGENLPRRACNVLALHEQRHRLIAAVQGPMDDLGAFRNEHPLGRFKPVEQLRLRQPGIHVQLRRGEIRYFNDVGHSIPFLILNPMTICQKTGRFFPSYTTKFRSKCQRFLRRLTSIFRNGRIHSL